ncbi:unnamed protein product [Prorocentrum cordatum]|uniref:Glutamine amidotransferase type-2 domain-containing protein n=1 Tax=Prorocentrum cordatum TaxID=2364126 RepID=A0ABN9X3D4_9DINO|nr:unnamed protein product [Polarella glacialis]
MCRLFGLRESDPRTSLLRYLPPADEPPWHFAPTSLLWIQDRLRSAKAPTPLAGVSGASSVRRGSSDTDALGVGGGQGSRSALLSAGGPADEPARLPPGLSRRRPGCPSGRWGPKATVCPALTAPLVHAAGAN